MDQLIESGWLSAFNVMKANYGLTDDASYTVGRVPPGSPISYHITARFADASATGSRRELRPCAFTALKH